MTVPIQFTIKKKGLENFRKEDMQKAGRASMKLAGDLYHKLYKPLKFAPNAQQRYKLRFRTKRYRRVKVKRGYFWVGEKEQGRRAVGEDKHFIFSGITRRLAMAGSKVVAKAPTAERHYADVIINAPALNFLPWVRAEFEKTNKNEIEKIEKAASKRYERHLTQNGKPTTRRTKK